MDQLLRTTGGSYDGACKKKRCCGHYWRHTKTGYSLNINSSAAPLLLCSILLRSLRGLVLQSRLDARTVVSCIRIRSLNLVGDWQYGTFGSLQRDLPDLSMVQ